jgi:hypothetical protein
MPNTREVYHMVTLGQTKEKFISYYAVDIISDHDTKQKDIRIILSQTGLQLCYFLTRNRLILKVEHCFRINLKRRKKLIPGVSGTGFCEGCTSMRQVIFFSLIHRPRGPKCLCQKGPRIHILFFYKHCAPTAFKTQLYSTTNIKLYLVQCKTKDGIWSQVPL